MNEELLKDYEMENPENAKAEAQIAKLKALEKEQKKKQASDSRTIAQITAATANQKRLQEFDRFDPDFVDAYKQDRSNRMRKKLEEVAQEKDPVQ